MVTRDGLTPRQAPLCISRHAHTTHADAISTLRDPHPLQLDHVAIRPLRAINSSWLPTSTIRAASSTRMRSALWIVLSRWAMTNEVRPRDSVGEALLDQPFALAVEVARRLVEDEDPRVGQHGAGDGQPLPLAAAEPHPALADQGS